MFESFATCEEPVDKSIAELGRNRNDHGSFYHARSLLLLSYRTPGLQLWYSVEHRGLQYLPCVHYLYWRRCCLQTEPAFWNGFPDGSSESENAVFC